MADVGQEEVGSSNRDGPSGVGTDLTPEKDFEAARVKALKVGAKKFFVEVRRHWKLYNFSEKAYRDSVCCRI